MPANEIFSTFLPPPGHLATNSPLQDFREDVGPLLKYASCSYNPVEGNVGSRLPSPLLVPRHSDKHIPNVSSPGWPNKTVTAAGDPT